MSDMNSAIIPKSDQLNYDDFIGKKSIIIKVTKVHIGTGEQKVSIFYEGDNGKPWKPCKSMCRVLVQCWGNDSKQYAGRSIELYGDSKVKWAGMEVGGIRIYALSDISEKQTIQLTSSKGKRNIFIVEKLTDSHIFDIEDSKEVLRKCLSMEALGLCFKELIKKPVKDSKEFNELVAVKDEMKILLESK